MAGLEATGTDRRPDELVMRPIQRASQRDAHALLVFPLVLLAVLLILAITLGASPPG